MKKVITFGEIMLRLNPPQYNRFVQAESFSIGYAGAEANVAVSLASYGVDTAFVTKLPSHEVGQMVVNSLRGYGVDTTKIVRGGERVGVLYCEKGASQRPGKVIYDRAYSAIALSQKDDFDWDAIFADAQWFHFSGITPALSSELAEICEIACQKAKEKGLTISCDINYRSKLWGMEEAERVMDRLLHYVDYCKDTIPLNAGFIGADAYMEVMQAMEKKYSLKGIAVTFREQISANDNQWSGMYYTDGKAYRSKTYSLHIVDRIGAGDSFSGAWIYSILSGHSPQKIIDFAIAASCLKHSIEGDYNMVCVAEVNKLADGDGSGRVQR